MIASSVKSSNRFLVVVPGPGTLLHIMYECFLVCELLVCGDVESNPGPDIESTLSDITAGQNVVIQAIAELKSQLTASQAALVAVNARVVELDKFLQEVKQSTDQIYDINSAIESLRGSVTQQSEKLVDLEDRSRRSNLVVYGVHEAPNETADQLKDKILNEIFEQKLGVKCSSVGRIHRLGLSNNKNRPAILYLQDYNEKQCILKNAKKLKGTRIFIENDYSRRTLHRCRLLHERARGDRANEEKGYLVNDKLRIDNDTFVWDEDKNARFRLPA